MQILWRETDNPDGSKGLFGAFNTNGLKEAADKANTAVGIIMSHRADKYSHMSLSQEGLVIMLHGVSKKKITDKDWTIADEIQKALDN